MASPVRARTPFDSAAVPPATDVPTAADTTAPSVAASAPMPAQGIVVLITHGDALPADLLRARLERELETTIASASPGSDLRGTLTITFHRATHELVVSWDSPDGRNVTRSITAREHDEDAVDDAVLLAGNLARTEADEIAGPKLGAPSPTEVAPPPPPPPLAPPPEERLPASASFFYPLATDADHRYRTSPLDFNLIYGRIGGIDGFQLGAVNVITPENGRGTGVMKGVELGLVTNQVARDVRGLQVAGLLNSVDGSVIGLELGLVNVVGNVRGMQLGAVNVARKVRGVTIGLVNIADDVDGLPLAPISVTKSGGVHPVAWSGTSGFANAGVKFATRHTYTTFFGAYHHDDGLDFWGGGLVIGGRIGIGGPFHADVDASGTYLIAPEQTTDKTLDRSYHVQLVQPRLRVSLAWRAAAHLGVFVGAAIVGQFRSELDWDRVTASVGPELFGGVEL